MGGALAVHTAIQNSCENNSQDGATQNFEDNNIIRNLVGICVIDVVEGTAMDALSSMQSFLRSRPKSFPSLGSYDIHPNGTLVAGEKTGRTQYSV